MSVTSLCTAHSAAANKWFDAGTHLGGGVGGCAVLQQRLGHRPVVVHGGQVQRAVAEPLH
jgi:hypothetical protein